MSWQACSPSCLICWASSLRALTTLSSAPRVERAEHDRLGGVVDDHVDAGRGLKGADVAALASDDPALELIGGQMHDGDRCLAALLRGLTLHGGDEDLAALCGRFLADLGLGLTDPLGDLGAELPPDAAHDLGASLWLGKRRHALELPGDGCPLILDRLAERLQFRLAPGQPLFVGVELAEPSFETFLALVGALLQACDLGTAFADLGLGLIATARCLLLGGQEHGFRLLLGGARLVQALLAVRVVAGSSLSHASASVYESRSRKCGRNNHQPRQGHDLDVDWVGPRRSE